MISPHVSLHEFHIKSIACSALWSNHNAALLFSLPAVKLWLITVIAMVTKIYSCMKQIAIVPLYGFTIYCLAENFQGIKFLRLFSTTDFMN